MRPPIWRLSVEPGPDELTVMRLIKRAKLFVFAVSSAMAGIGGALLTQSEENWDTTTFNPVFGLFWFVAGETPGA